MEGAAKLTSGIIFTKSGKKKKKELKVPNLFLIGKLLLSLYIQNNF
jgi:hypothetical protein